MDFNLLCRSLVLVCIIVLVYPGCSKRRTTRMTELESIDKLGTLTKLRQTHDPRLRAELARIEAEEGTPELLRAQDTHTGKKAKSMTAAQLATELDRIIPAHDLHLILVQLDKIYPAGSFHFDPVRLRQAIQIEQQWARQRRQYLDLFAHPDFRFRVNWMRGMVADLGWVNHARLCHRLLAISVADSLSAGQPAEAVLPIRQMLDIDRKLARVKNVVARLTAARLRAEALQVVAAVIQHPRCSATIIKSLHGTIQDQLSDWPPDRDAWVGDRALGLHTYEMVRDGRLPSLLTEQEISALKKKKEYAPFVKAVTVSVDMDERFYLAAMREFIAACDRPYYARAKTFEKFRERLDEVRDTPRYPLFAARILFPEIESGQRLQALDRARCEAWSLALGKALGKKVAADQVNPLTGQPYQLEQTETSIEVTAIDPDDDTNRVRVPVRS